MESKMQCILTRFQEPWRKTSPTSSQILHHPCFYTKPTLSGKKLCVSFNQRTQFVVFWWQKSISFGFLLAIQMSNWTCGDLALKILPSLLFANLQLWSLEKCLPHPHHHIREKCPRALFQSRLINISHPLTVTFDSFNVDECVHSYK